MKIGIITLPLHTNYGGILQAWALQTVLERMGHEVEYIEYEQKKHCLPIKIRYLVYAKRLIRKIFTRSRERIFLENYYNRTNHVVRQNTDKFIGNHIHIRYIKSFNDVHVGDYSALIVGSDQVWRNGEKRERTDFSVFLDFAESWNINKLSYASSFGGDKWTYSPESTAKIANLLKTFNAVSVREESAVKILKDNVRVEARHVLDPTMLLSMDDYMDIIKQSNTHSSAGDLMCYILDEKPETTTFINRIESEKGYISFRSNSKVEDIMAPLKDRIQPPLEQWLKGFEDAKLIITDSFHACVFSILFNKPFICLGNGKRGMSRFESLFSLIDQPYRLVKDLDRVDERCYCRPDAILSTSRDNSLNYLKYNL